MGEQLPLNHCPTCTCVWDSTKDVLAVLDKAEQRIKHGEGLAIALGLWASMGDRGPVIERVASIFEAVYPPSARRKAVLTTKDRLTVITAMRRAVA